MELPITIEVIRKGKWYIARALELDCDIVLKATNIDGVYDADPRTNPQAKKYD
jgi:uridylate kinase